MEIGTKKIVIGLLAIIVLIGGLQYAKEKNNTSKISDIDFLKIFDKPEKIKIWAKGDINGDGFVDAVVSETTCGASCGTRLSVILNDQNLSGKILDPNNDNTFEPAYQGSGATKSELTEVIIKDGNIYLTGYGLFCNQNQTDYCSSENWHQIKTATFRFDGHKIVQIPIR